MFEKWLDTINGWLEALENAIGDTGMQLIPAALLGLAVAIPALRILMRAGMSRAWALLAVIPPGLGTIVFLWVVAFSSWRVQREG
jgi:hypothetical protein